MYVADAGNNVIYKVTPDGTISIFAGQYGSTAPNYYAEGTGTAAVFNNPRGIAVDANENVYVADSNNQVVRKITPAGVVSLYAGKPNFYSNTDGPFGTGTLFRPNAITVDANGIVYVTDMNLKIRKITPDQTITTVASLTGPAYGLVIDPSDPTNPNHIFYVTDYSNHAVFRINRDGTRTTIAGIPGGPGYKDGNALGEALFNKPFGLARDTDGALYVADSGNITTLGHSIRKISPDGTTVSTVAGSGTNGYADGTGAAALFDTPKGLAIDSNGNIYVGDAMNRKIRVIK
jgi:sugar lactone lactonase YvrE